MRNVNLYQLYDKRARTPVGPIIAQVTPTIIVRELIEQLNEGKTHIARHPADFVIYHLGTQDLDTGIITHYVDDDLNQGYEIVAEVSAIASGVTRTSGTFTNATLSE